MPGGGEDVSSPWAESTAQTPIRPGSSCTAKPVSFGYPEFVFGFEQADRSAADGVDCRHDGLRPYPSEKARLFHGMTTNGGAEKSDTNPPVLLKISPARKSAGGDSEP